MTISNRSSSWDATPLISCLLLNGRENLCVTSRALRSVAISLFQARRCHKLSNLHALVITDMKSIDPWRVSLESDELHGQAYQSRHSTSSRKCWQLCDFLFGARVDVATCIRANATWLVPQTMTALQFFRLPGWIFCNDISLMNRLNMIPTNLIFTCGAAKSLLFYQISGSVIDIDICSKT